MFGFGAIGFFPFVVPVGYDYRDVKLFLYVNFPRNARKYTISYSDVKNCHRQLLYSAQKCQDPCNVFNSCSVGALRARRQVRLRCTIGAISALLKNPSRSKTSCRRDIK